MQAVRGWPSGCVALDLGVRLGEEVVVGDREGAVGRGIAGDGGGEQLPRFLLAERGAVMGEAEPIAAHGVGGTRLVSGAVQEQGAVAGGVVELGDAQ